MIESKPIIFELRNAEDQRPKHLQRCLCWDRYMNSFAIYVYNDESKEWCSNTSNDVTGAFVKYDDYRISAWAPMPEIVDYIRIIRPRNEKV